MKGLVAPPAVPPGARVEVVAPSGPVPHARFDRGLRVLRRLVGKNLVVAEQVSRQAGFFAGTDDERRDALQAALAAPHTAAVFAARGGYGVTRLLARLDPAPLREHPKLVVGFSDVTALLCWVATAAGLRALHGPVVTQLGALGPDDLDRLGAWLAGGVPPPLSAQEGTCIAGGTVEGPLLPGNLEVLRSLTGTRHLPSATGAILAVEEVGEAPYRIDRALTHLLSAGFFRGVRGVVVGDLSRCENPNAPPGAPTARDVFVERLGTLGVPVVTGFPFGHAPDRNAALPVGAPVRLHADDCTLEFLEPVTR